MIEINIKKQLQTQMIYTMSIIDESDNMLIGIFYFIRIE